MGKDSFVELAHVQHMMWSTSYPVDYNLFVLKH